MTRENVTSARGKRESLSYQLRAFRTTFGPGAFSKDFLDNAADALDAAYRREAALHRMVHAFKPFTMKPMGGEGSIARLEQQEQIEAHAEALAALGAST